jgi:uncharacterized RDD family membrane protein YckC
VICPQCGTLNQNTEDKCLRCKRPLHPESMKGKIACSVHANREATTACGTCGIRLCDACAVNWNGIDYCSDHAPAEAVNTEVEEDYEKVPVVDPSKTELATFDSRAGAIVVDVLLIALVAGVLAMGFWLTTQSLNFITSATSSPIAYWLYRFLIFAGIPIYVVVSTAMSGQTVGKQITGVIILEPDGHILNLQRSIMRMLATIVSILPLGLGFLWAIWDEKHETWHDKISKTTAFKWGGGL